MYVNDRAYRGLVEECVVVERYRWGSYRIRYIYIYIYRRWIELNKDVYGGGGGGI